MCVHGAKPTDGAVVACRLACPGHRVPVIEARPIPRGYVSESLPASRAAVEEPEFLRSSPTLAD